MSDTYTHTYSAVHTPDCLRYPYPYLQQLLAIATCHPRPAPPTLSDQLGSITTPLNLAAWQVLLSNHPDKQFTRLIIEGIQTGFRVGFAYSHAHELKSRYRNMPSAAENPSVVEAYLHRELGMNRMSTIPPLLSMGPLESLRGNTQRTQTREMAAHSGPLGPRRPQCEPLY